jgi:hypothetical protein
LNFATVWVRDQARSRRFFVEQLGFQVVVDAEVPGGAAGSLPPRPLAYPASRSLFHAKGPWR